MGLRPIIYYFMNKDSNTEGNKKYSILFKMFYKIKKRQHFLVSFLIMLMLTSAGYMELRTL